MIFGQTIPVIRLNPSCLHFCNFSLSPAHLVLLTLHLSSFSMAHADIQLVPLTSAPPRS